MERNGCLCQNTAEIPVHKIGDKHFSFEGFPQIKQEFDRFGCLKRSDEGSGEGEVAGGGFGSVGSVAIEVFEGGVDGELTVHAGDGTVNEGEGTGSARCGEGEFDLRVVQCVDHHVGIIDEGHVASRVETVGDGADSCRGIDSEEVASDHLYFLFAEYIEGGKVLSVEVVLVEGIRIDQRQPPHTDAGEHLGDVPPEPSAADDRHTGIQQLQLPGGIDGLTVAGIAEGEDIFLKSPAFDFPKRQIKSGGDLLFRLKREEAVTGMIMKGLDQVIQGGLLGRSCL